MTPIREKLMRILFQLIALVLLAACANTTQSPGYQHTRQWDDQSLENENFERQRVR